ncbi:type III glutamate--ammonia ligase [Niveibacterium sp. 24ML]|uniref:type III glutamate--ammonia ligase n=1 Tax=Niveibacterium sp. 24ML TaxID=2985512 RepID=UPI00226D68A0|nr:type III glutamate--ammonia ligase [Niveibacterium sp. 24ML]MCX9156427.1 type III glutamate--ammonia ligase [Niveibacterium sp. 24ML]
MTMANGAELNSVEMLKARLREAGVRYVFAQFTDIQGVAKGKTIPLAHLEDVFLPGAGFSGPSIWGTGLPRHGLRSEYYGRGDITTAQVLPWLPGHARIVCDGYVGGEPFDLCPRQILRRQVERLAARGWTLNAGLEPEFFLLQRNADGSVRPADAHDHLEKPSYDYKSLTRQQAFLGALTDALQACGLDVFQIDHEDASGQYELNYHYSDALTAADRFMLFKMAAHSIAESLGMVFSMMPKPFANMPGSGLHFHLSIADEAGGAVFTDRSDAQGLGLSRTGYHFLAGLLHHAPALAALCAPTVNSYKRLVVGESLSGTTWAPAHIGYGDNNRTMLVRVAHSRLEWRLPDASANPYLALAAVIAAGLDGVARALEPGAPFGDDAYELPLSVLRERGLGQLPGNLGDAVSALEADTVLGEALGSAFTAEFCRFKRMEWIEYSRAVHSWETERYADRF